MPITLRHPRRLFGWTLSLCLCAGALAACSDDNDGDGGRRRYQIDLDDVDPDITVGDLSDNELGEICGSYSAYVDAEISFEALSYVVCLPGAIVLGGGDPDECGRQLDQCMGLFPDPIEIAADTGNNQVCIDGLRSCNASISGLEGCVNLNLGFLLDILDNWTCGDADEARMREAAKVMDTLNVCADASASCGLTPSPNSPF